MSTIYIQAGQFARFGRISEQLQICQTGNGMIVDNQNIVGFHVIVENQDLENVATKLSLAALAISE